MKTKTVEVFTYDQKKSAYGIGFMWTPSPFLERKITKMLLQYINVKLTLAKFRYYGWKPSIDRVTNMYQGFQVTDTDKHVKVQDGHRVRYFPVGEVFHNVYRIVSRAGTPDHITHKVL